MAVSQRIIFAIIVLCCTFNFGLCEESTGVPNDTSVAEERTFGHHFLKRISFAIVPAAFVVGVITTLLAALTVVSLKGLGVGVILLILAIGQILSRTFVAQATSAAYTAPIPIVYSHHSREVQPNPLWIEKDWA